MRAASAANLSDGAAGGQDTTTMQLIVVTNGQNRLGRRASLRNSTGCKLDLVPFVLICEG